MEDALLRHPFRARNRAEPILLRCGRVVHAPKFTHARDYTGLRRLTFRRRCAPMLPAAAPCSHACCRIPGRSVVPAIRGLGGAQVRQHGFHDVRPGRSREHRYVGDRHRLRVRAPRNGTDVARHLARRQLADADRQHAARIAACDRGVCGRILLPVVAIRMNFISGKSAMSCSAYSSLCCTPDGMKFSASGQGRAAAADLPENRGS